MGELRVSVEKNCYLGSLSMTIHGDFPGGLEGKESACNAGDLGSISGEGHGNPFQYSFLEKPMDRGAWPATVHGVIKSQT